MCLLAALTGCSSGSSHPDGPTPSEIINGHAITTSIPAGYAAAIAQFQALYRFDLFHGTDEAISDQIVTVVSGSFGYYAVNAMPSANFEATYGSSIGSGFQSLMNLFIQAGMPRDDAANETQFVTQTMRAVGQAERAPGQPSATHVPPARVVAPPAYATTEPAPPVVTTSPPPVTVSDEKLWTASAIPHATIVSFMTLANGNLYSGPTKPRTHPSGTVADEDGKAMGLSVHAEQDSAGQLRTGSCTEGKDTVTAVNGSGQLLGVIGGDFYLCIQGAEGESNPDGGYHDITQTSVDAAGWMNPGLNSIFYGNVTTMTGAYGPVTFTLSKHHGVLTLSFKGTRK